MTEPAVFSCEGAPRDLGFDQGAACGAAIRDRAAREGASADWLGRWRPFDARAWPRIQAAARDVRRHYPHLDERVIGISRGAKVPERALHALLARELGPDAAGAGLQAGLDPEGRLVVVSPEPGVLRQAKPDAYFTAVEWTLPWLPGAYAGVNSGGLAVAARSPGSDDVEGCAGPAFLLLQNCLHQFDSIEGALEWCESRPCGGRAELLFGDAKGGRALLRIDGDKRSRLDALASPVPATGAEPGVRLVLDPDARTLNVGATRLTPDG